MRKRSSEPEGSALEAREILLILSGLLFITSGCFYITGFFPLSSLPLETVIAISMVLSGAVLAILGLLRVRNGGPAVLLVLSLVVLLVASTGILAVSTRAAKPFVKSVGPGDVGAVSGLVLECDVDLGSVEIRSTSGRDFYVRAVYYTNASGSLRYEVVDGLLVVNISLSSSPLELYVADWLPWSADVDTDMGSIEAYLNATNLKSLVLSSSLGSVELHIEAASLTSNCTIRVQTSLGSIQLDAEVGEEVGCQIEARTSLGSLDKELNGFTVVEERWNYLCIRSSSFEEASKFMYVSVRTVLGSVEVRARRP
ncbi:hypothetical protein B6U66_02670 [Candidatus Bathyarchaeota archaeon ex4484_135]|nr:MAG: hypothetical protein B6U66_02670 [Candidatus Bathyarchaeota archaeon ex4484_135]